jgi:hypothetical protein
VDGCHDLSDEEKGDRMRDAFKDLPVHVMLTFISNAGDDDLAFAYGNGQCLIGDDAASMPYATGCINALGMILKRLWVNVPFVLREITTEIKTSVMTKVQSADVQAKLKMSEDVDVRGDGIVDHTLWIMNGPHPSQWLPLLMFGMHRPSPTQPWNCIRLVMFRLTMEEVAMCVNAETVGTTRARIADAMQDMTPLQLQTLIRSRLERSLASLGNDSQRALYRETVNARLLRISPESVHDAVADVGSQLPQRVVIDRPVVKIGARLVIDDSLASIYGPCVMSFSGLDHIPHQQTSTEGCIALIISFIRERWGLN